MNQLTKYLISEILDGQKVTAVFGGGFKPPTKGHFDIVKKALDDYKEIDKFIIYVGGGVRDGITQEQSIQIWQMYKEILGNKVEIIPASNPIGDVKRYAKNNPDEKVYFVIGAREGREDDLADVSQRTAGVEEKYPNTEVKLITTPDSGMSGTNARKALKNGNKEEFFTYLPEKVPASEKESIWDLLNDALVKETEGKAAPFGSGYKKVNEKNGFGGQTRYRAIEKRGDKYYYIQDNPFAPGIRQEFGPYKTKEQAKKKMGTFPPSQNYRDLTQETSDPQSGRSAPYGSGYAPFKKMKND